MRTTLATLAVLAAVGLLAAWFFLTHEKVVVEAPAAYQGEARLNRFFAAELLLRELGLEADSRASLLPSEWLPETWETLLASSSAAFASEDELERLERWVLNGGHLVLLAPESSTLATGAVFARFGFRSVDVEPPTDAPLTERVLSPGSGSKSKTAYTLGNVAGFKSLEIADDDFAGAALGDELGIFVARRQWGNGYVTALASSAPFENGFLEESDHARLLLDVVAGYVEPGRVWLVYGAEFPPLWRLVWSSAPYAVLGVALTLVFWLWAVMPRFGPPVAPALPVRRSIIEHVEAAGRFVWRHDGAATLVASSVAAVLRRAELTHPGIGRLPPAEQAALIAEMTGQAERAVLAALEPAESLGPRELTHKIKTLQTMRKKL